PISWRVVRGTANESIYDSWMPPMDPHGSSSISCPWPRDWVSWIPKPWLAWLHSARKWGESSTASSTPSGTPRDAPKNCGRRPLLLKLRTPDSSLRTEPVGRGLSRWWEFYSDGLLALRSRADGPPFDGGRSRRERSAEAPFTSVRARRSPRVAPRFS